MRKQLLYPIAREVQTKVLFSGSREMLMVKQSLDLIEYCSGKAHFPFISLFTFKDVLVNE